MQELVFVNHVMLIQIMETPSTDYSMDVLKIVEKGRSSTPMEEHSVILAQLTVLSVPMKIHVPSAQLDSTLNSDLVF